MSKERIYSEKDIKKIDPRDHVRRRPGMYIGGTGKKALHHLIDELIDFTLESVFVGACDTIEIRLQPDNYVTISDNDQLFSELLAKQDYDERRSRYVLDLAFCEFMWQRPSLKVEEYRVQGGLHGVGVTVVNPLASSMQVAVRHQNQVWKRSYRKGKISGAYQTYEMANSQTGLTVTFQPDFTIFDENDFDYEWIAERCHDLAYPLPDLSIMLTDERSPKHRQDIFHYPDGIQAMVRDLNKGKTVKHDVLFARETLTFKDRQNKPFDVIVELALQYTESDDITLHGFINTIALRDGGTHIKGLQHALMGYINGAHQTHQKWEEVARGLTAVINIFHPYPEFESATKHKLLSREGFDAVVQVTYPLFTNANLRHFLQ